MTNMRAKVRVSGVIENIGQPAEEGAPGNKLSEKLTFNAVAASNYPADGSDENNTFAKWSPSAEFTITVANPALWGKFEVNKEYYVDFTPVPEKKLEDVCQGETVASVPEQPAQPAETEAAPAAEAPAADPAPAADAPATE